MSRPSVHDHFVEGQYATFLRLAVREELTNPSSSLLTNVFAANIALWKLTDAEMCIRRMQQGERARSEEILADLKACSFADAVSKASLLVPEVSKAISVGVVGKAMSIADNDVRVTAKITSIPADKVLDFYRLYEASVGKGWGSNTASELARTAAFIQA